ncbi:transcriptional regulator [Terracoccus luteus]|uniref:Transcriptional regulator n=1 Tax=Terracoccus luteus TaxID=53356 RepID=A0A495Y1U0_9MICO|nr:sugar-binding domain-containing protein [Terracoccus luteus]RKT79174.1 transcriptional regulator [Terracoccus luteus]
MTREGRGPAELVLAATVARRHYLQGRSKVEIADELNVSRFKVARLLDFARDSGMVRIEIVADGEVDLDRSARLQEAYSLRHSVVVDGAALDPHALAVHLGDATARLLREVLTRDDVLGLPWARTIDIMSHALTGLPPVDVVQMTGAMEIPGVDSSAVDIVRRAARLTGGSSSIFHAPLMTDDVVTASTLRRDGKVARGLAEARRITHAVMGIGAWADGLSTVYDAATPAERREALEFGVVGETGGRCFDAEGRLVDPPLADRIVTIGADELRAIPEVIGVVSGRPKAAAVAAAVRGGLVNALVVDTEHADALLDLAD